MHLPIRPRRLRNRPLCELFTALGHLDVLARRAMSNPRRQRALMRQCARVAREIRHRMEAW